MIKGNKKTIRAWVFYDWANSVYALVITTAIFPIFYALLTSSRDVNGNLHDQVKLFGLNFRNTELMSYVMSISYLIVSFLSPLLSGIADYSGNKKFFLKLFCYIGSFSCAGLYFFSMDYFAFSLLMVISASVGFWGSIVFYNSYLPEIAETKDHDKISARGFSMGYFGSALLLIICLALVLSVDTKVEKIQMMRISFLMVAAWWFGFAQITLKKLPNNISNKEPTGNKFTKGFLELKKVIKEVRSILRLKRFLTAFFVYSIGLQTVMIMATYFGEKEIQWPDGDATTGLITSILIIQFIAIIGSNFHSWLSTKIGNIKTLMFSISIWTGICLLAWFVTLPMHFYVVAGLVGFVMGGVQALSRSTYSKLLPTKTLDHASFFSFYDVAEKIAIVIGTLIFGIIEGLTGSMRNSILSIGGFFLIGFILLLFVPKHERLEPKRK